MMISKSDALHMARAIKLAEEGMKKGDGGPFGAVVVKNDQIIGSGWNRVLQSNDPTAHAEIVAIRSACAHIDSYRLEGCTLYVNCEPCPMCLAAIYWARIERLCFGASRKDAAAIGFDDDHIYQEVCLPVHERKLEITTIS
ncbi:MAG: nucleoside deaminase, partial [Desulfobulbaceae bacterium]|nr:nucleoside deaminase [Desulfobulbaceae bacterium]